MNLLPAFWDSSALIPLCVQQTQTERATALFEDHGVVVWWSTPIEIVSGLTRLLRMHEIGAEEFRAGKQLAEIIATTWRHVEPSERIAHQAKALLELYALSAADAAQLAAAMEWCEGQPKGNVFLTLDQRLREAAGLAGFTLE
jgi:predicted nucleic acid-binding protein